jgi:hypothetical protein
LNARVGFPTTARAMVDSLFYILTSDCSAERLISFLSHCLLRIEFEYTSRDGTFSTDNSVRSASQRPPVRSAFRSPWTEKRRCFKWRQLVRSSRSYARLASCLSVLHDSITWSSLWLASFPLTKQQFCSLAGPEHVVGLPDEGSTVVFYSAGQRSAAEADAIMLLPAMWGSSVSDDSGDVLQCKVAKVRLFLHKRCTESVAGKNATKDRDRLFRGGQAILLLLHR